MAIESDPVDPDPVDPDPVDPDLVARARHLVASAQRMVVLTGAGVSTDSGIPDFRGPDGVWTKNPEAEKAATLSRYMSDEAVRRAAWQRRLGSGMWDAVPNRAHEAIARLEADGRLDLLVTQNIDGLHLVAGSSPERTVEIHGNVAEAVCLTCTWRGPMEDTLDRVRAGEADPHCLQCGGLLKSATISFGQSLVAEDLARAEDAARRCDVLMAAGTTLTVSPICEMVPVAAHYGARVVILNGSPTAYDDLADVVVPGPLSVTLPAVCDPPQP